MSDTRIFRIIPRVFWYDKLCSHSTDWRWCWKSFLLLLFIKTIPGDFLLFSPRIVSNPIFLYTKVFKFKNNCFLHFYLCQRLKKFRHFDLPLVSKRFIHIHFKKGNFINFTLRLYEILNCLKCDMVKQDDWNLGSAYI